MKKIFFLFLLIPILLNAQTKRASLLFVQSGLNITPTTIGSNINPFGNELGNLGATEKRWNFGYLDTTITNHLNTTTFTLSSFASGSVLFAGASGAISQDNANLFWDNVNKRLGIGRVPGVPLEVKGQVRSYAGIGGQPSLSLFQDGIIEWTFNNEPTTGDLIVRPGAAKNAYFNVSPTITALYLKSTGNVGIKGITNPTAYLHIAAGTATANTAPLKFTPGVLLTTPEPFAMEVDATGNLYFTNASAARKTIAFLESPAFTTPNIGEATGTSLNLSGLLKINGGWEINNITFVPAPAATATHKLAVMINGATYYILVTNVP